ncbi:olfactory receptor 11A1-like [Periophthalmus magnuspinnatus]|uniref:olfactory receptor 11A1-like n=1 Tax=Periophthalmus magnuspinnatus TaxID=409849 RepID=UPI00145B5125|nr:olfactory receptor 11A1-like [Periophthalmus magnuspinnatus]
MFNSSEVTQFSLVAFRDPGMFRFLFFSVALILYILIVFSNVLLIVVVYLSRTLHEPMYVLLCSLFLNELWGSSAMLPFLLVQILRDAAFAPYSLCLLQLFCVYSYASVEFTSLSVISYDRYVAICCPLEYHARMSPNKVRVLVVLIWLPPLVAVAITTILTASLTLCGNVIDKVYCDNYCIVKLSCYDTTVNNWYELVAASLTVVAPLVVIFYTYVQILRVCFRGSAHTRQKAVSTCAPHLGSVLNLGFGVLFEVIQTRFDTSVLPTMLRILLPVYHVTVQPLLNPLMYGLNLRQIRRQCQRLLLKHNKTVDMG